MSKITRKWLVLDPQAVDHLRADDIPTSVPNETVQEALDGKQSALTAASQAEMEAGVETALRAMSPALVAAAIAALATGGGSPQQWTYTETSVNKTLADNEWCKVLVAGLTLTLPTGGANKRWRVTVKDFDNTVLARNGATINDVADDRILNVPNSTVTGEYDGTTWRTIFG